MAYPLVAGHTCPFGVEDSLEVACHVGSGEDNRLPMASFAVHPLAIRTCPSGAASFAAHPLVVRTCPSVVVVLENSLVEASAADLVVDSLEVAYLLLAWGNPEVVAISFTYSLLI